MTPPATLHALLAGAIDYAGLFPPARLPMPDAVGRYASYAADRNAWALGRFVVPSARFDELVTVRHALPDREKRSWQLSAILGANLVDDCALVRGLNEAESERTFVDSVEMKVAGSPATIRNQMAVVRRAIPTSIRVFAELPVGMAPREFAEAARVEGVLAKVRTGGVTAEAFPAVSDLADFLLACAENQLPFKATAGLHHPCRGSYPLTYDSQSPRGTMFGFLNVFVAATTAYVGVARGQILAILLEEQGAAFRFTDHDITWRDVRVSREQVMEARSRFALSFGSCSFEEPIRDLRGLSLL